MPGPYPAIDQTLCSSWNEQESTMYHSYAFYLAKYEIAQRNTWATHSRMMGTRRWTPNMGPILRGVRKESSPHVRQETFPRELSQAALKDVTDVQEMTINSTLKHHKFESRIFNFLPSFQDFLTDHVSFTSKDIVEKKIRFGDIFCRTSVFHQAPHVMVADNTDGPANLIVGAPMWDGMDMANIALTGKTAVWRATITPKVGNPGNLSLNTIYLADSFLREEIRAPAWSGGSQGKPADNERLAGNNCLILSNEAYNQLRFDPFLMANRALSLDIVTAGFKGLPGGNVVCRIEDLPLRMARDGSFPAPQTRELAAVYNLNETVISTAYKDAPYEWAFLYAAEGFESLESGPPPKDFVGNSVPKGFNDMFWNGEVKLIKTLAIPCLDENGNATFDLNEYGEYMKFICHAVYGVLGTQRRYVLPILFKRVRGA